MRRIARLRAVLRRLLGGLFAKRGSARRVTVLALACSTDAADRKRGRFVLALKD